MTDDNPALRAATWLATQKEPPARVVPELRERFGLSALEACQAIKEAQLIRARLFDFSRRFYAGHTVISANCVAVLSTMDSQLELLDREIVR